MNVIHLSDHVNDQIKRYEAGRTQTEELLRTRYKNAVIQRRTAFKAAFSKIAHSLFPLSFRNLGIGISDWQRAQYMHVPPKPHKLVPGDRESAYIAGRDGEERVLAKLRKALGNSWTALVGYKSSMGEIDIVVVGPDGIAAIEIKNKVGLITCDGDLWQRFKSGSWETMTDRNGRSPSVQLNECANQLERVLAQYGVAQHVARIVVLANRHSSYGQPFSTTVDWAGKLQDLKLRKICLKHFRSHQDSEQVRSICDAVCKDHQLGAEKSRPGDNTPLLDPSYSGITQPSSGGFTRDPGSASRSEGRSILKWVFIIWIGLNVIGFGLNVIRSVRRGTHPTDPPHTVDQLTQPVGNTFPEIHKHPHRNHKAAPDPQPVQPPEGSDVSAQ